MDQYIGKMLDNRYEILERIGTGGMAVVYKARCHRLNRLVAIKILKAELASDEDFLRRFQAESQAVAMLSHINIVSIYDVCRSDGLDYIVMELIDGMTLKQYMQKRGVPLNWREAVHFITQIARALGHAHSRGIVHRDIKPHNIMVLRDGSVKVTDFGIARLTSAAQATLTQEALGSVHYISPEQAKGSHVDGRSDLYSVGVMLYEMLTGRLPFEGETPVFVAIQHINSIPIAPRELNPDIPEALEAITMKAMAPNADQRYSSAEALLNDLKEFRKNPGVVIAQTPQAAEEEEIEEPTMVVPVSSIGEALEKQQEKQPEPPRKEVKEPRPVRQEAPAQEEERYVAPRRRGGIIPSLFGILAFILIIGGIGYFLYTFLIKDLLTPALEYTIPDLRGYTVEQIAENDSLLNGFTIKVGPTIDDANYNAGQICRQTPSANSIVKDPDTVITVTISSGEEQLYMPDVTNWEAREAVWKLQDMGLIVDQKRENSDTVTAGLVIWYTPYDGTRVQKGDTVTIYISDGPKVIYVPVPPFINMNIEQAIGQAESLGLVVDGVDYFYSDEYAADRVMWQSINADTEVEKGSVISFQVSMGPEPVQDPDPDNSTELPPSQNVESVQTVQVDLSAYNGTVSLRIIVGDVTWFDSNVDCTATSTVTREITGTGTQQVSIYINNELVDTYPLEF